MNKVKLIVVVLLFFTSVSSSLKARTPYNPSIPPDILHEFEILRKRFLQNPNHVPTLNSLGILYARAGQPDDAIEIWTRGLKIDPGYVHLYNNLASVLKSQKKYDDARKMYHQALRLAPSYFVYYNLGLLEREVGRPDEALKCFQQCLRLLPNFMPAVNQVLELERIIAGRNINLSQFPLPLSVENKEPVDYSEIGQMPAPWEIEAAYLESYETNQEQQFSGKARNNPILHPPISVEDCVKIISKIPASPDEKVIALTFDDGPHAELTPKLLDLLRAEKVLATFFLIGERAETYPDIVVRMAREGHEIGNHSWNHRSLVNLGVNKAIINLQQTASFLTSISGKPCKLVRPPFGHTNSSIRAAIHKQGWREILWDVDSRDWQGGTESQILSRILRRIGPGTIILFHDIRSGALRVLPTLITALKRCGYRFVTVSQLLGLTDPAS